MWGERKMELAPRWALEIMDLLRRVLRREGGCGSPDRWVGAARNKFWRRPVTCWSCGRFGHLARRCPDTVSSWRAEERGQPGHVVRECPEISSYQGWSSGQPERMNREWTPPQASEFGGEEEKPDGEGGELVQQADTVALMGIQWWYEHADSKGEEELVQQAETVAVMAAGGDFPEDSKGEEAEVWPKGSDSREEDPDGVEEVREDIVVVGGVDIVEVLEREQSCLVPALDAREAETATEETAEGDSTAPLFALEPVGEDKCEREEEPEKKRKRKKKKPAVECVDADPVAEGRRRNAEAVRYYRELWGFMLK